MSGHVSATQTSTTAHAFERDRATHAFRLATDAILVENRRGRVVMPGLARTRRNARPSPFRGGSSSPARPVSRASRSPRRASRVSPLRKKRPRKIPPPSPSPPTASSPYPTARKPTHPIACASYPNSSFPTTRSCGPAMTPCTSCLVPTSGSAPITKAGILDLDSGSLATVLDGPISSENGYDIYDVRCSSRGIIWTEANAFTGEWRVYHATHSGESIGDPMLADHGTTDYEIPTLAVSEARAFWQVLPSAGPERRRIAAQVIDVRHEGDRYRLPGAQRAHGHAPVFLRRGRGDHAAHEGIGGRLPDHARRRNVHGPARCARPARVHVSARGGLRERPLRLFLRRHLQREKRHREPRHLCAGQVGGASARR